MTLPIKIHERHKLAIVPDMNGVSNLIPHARRIEKNGRQYLLIPAKKEELQLLRNLGFDAPTPLSIDYDWGGNIPFDAQVGTTDMLIHNNRAYVLSDMGTGKTLSTLFAFDYLRKNGLARKMLVIAPLSTLTTVWEREVFTRMNHLSCVSLHHSGGAAKRRQLLAQDHDIYIINHHGVATILDELIARRDIDVVCVDELAVFKNKQTNLWKNANAVCQGRKFVWGLTGSPTPKQPSDAWAQIMLITPNNTTKWFKQFREKTMRQLTQFKWIPKPDANDTVYAQMQPAVRYTRSDCVDLPPTTYTSHEVALSKEQQKAYKDIKDQCYAEFLEGTVTAVNEGVKVSKLLQVACGFAYTEHRAVVRLDDKARVEEAKDLIDATSNKIIIFVPFIEGVNHLHSELENAGYDVAKVYGDTPKPKRDEIFNLFQNSMTYKAIIAHPQCMAHGLTLTAADTVVWYVPPMSLEIYEQANARITRPGQKHNTLIVHIESTAIERKIYNRLENRAKVQGALLDMFEEDKKLT